MKCCTCDGGSDLGKTDIIVVTVVFTVPPEMKHYGYGKGRYISDISVYIVCVCICVY